MRLTTRVVLMTALAVLLAAGLAFAIPPVINYQGKLVDSVGDPVNTSVDITFTIYNAPTGGDVLWTETQTVGVVNGIFNVYLGSISTIPDSTFSTDIVYLGIQVAGNAEMTPRQLYSAAPFAFRAHSADMVAEGAVTSAMIANGTILGEDIAADTITSNEIATGAVGTSEIADGTITGTDIAADTITAGNIATGGVGTSEILDNSIGSIDIADGTITGADISAVAAISASKIDRTGLDADTLDGTDSAGFAASLHSHGSADITDGTIVDADISSSANIAASKIDRTGLDADTLDGVDSAVFSRKYAKVAVVALSGGDYTSPVDAVTDLSSWCGTPLVTGPCLIKVMPGIYDVGTNPVVLQPLLSIEGSGMNSTLINGTINSSSSGVIIGAEISEIKHLIVQNYGTGAYAVAISHDTGTGDPLLISDVRAVTEGATNCFTIRSDGSASIEIRNVKASARCTGANKAIYSNGSNLTIENTRVEVESVSGNAYGIHMRNSQYSYVSNVHVDAYTSGVLNAAGVYYESSTGEMHNVVVEAKGGSPKGILIEQSPDVTMKNVTAKASEPAGGSNISGINISGSDVKMFDVNVEANSSSGTGDVYGIYADTTLGNWMEMKNIRVNATGGINCFGIDARGATGGYMPMADVMVWCINGATGSVGIRADGGSGGNSGDFGMKNVEAYGASDIGTDSYGIWLLNNAYASMQGVEALGNSGTATNYGIYAIDSSIEGVNVIAQGEGGDTGYSHGLFLDSSGSDWVRITGGHIKSHGGQYGYGVYLSTDSNVELNSVKVEAVSAPNTYGILGDGSSGNIILRNSIIEGATATVSLSGGYQLDFAFTGFLGLKPVGGGARTCYDSYQYSGGTYNGISVTTGCN